MAENIRTNEDFEKAAKEVTSSLAGYFKPEFLNRVDDIIVFRPLAKEQLVKIVDLRLEDLRRQLAERKISLELTDAAKEFVLNEGYDPNFGARPLKRAIQRAIQDPLALKILDGEVLHGDHVIVDVDKKTGKLKFKVSERVGEKKPRQDKSVSFGFAQEQGGRPRPPNLTDQGSYQGAPSGAPSPPKSDRGFSRWGLPVLTARHSSPRQPAFTKPLHQSDINVTPSCRPVVILNSPRTHSKHASAFGMGFLLSALRREPPAQEYRAHLLRVLPSRLGVLQWQRA